MNLLDLTANWAGILSLGIFIVAYVLVVFEESTHMRKSKPVMLAAGLIWALIGIAYSLAGEPDVARAEIIVVVEEYGELFLFLLVAITYVNAMDERRTFEVLRARLVSSGLGYRQLFLLTGVLAFFLAALLDNLTTALVIGCIVMALGRESPRFVTLGCISVVVAANAGGAFSPFGNITTLMVWQKGKLELFEFFTLFLPAVVNWAVPAALLYLAVPKEKPPPVTERLHGKPGMLGVVFLFGCTIACAVSFKNFLHLPPAIGMMLGVSLLMIYSWYLSRSAAQRPGQERPLDVFSIFSRLDWDTMLFFYGIIFAVGGLGVLGYLAFMSELLYTDLGPTTANVLLGVLSAIIDNIPLMFAVLKMDPAMSDGQWLLITLTCGVGGSLLSIGSAAGVALMGQARGVYTFMSHLRWSWAVGLGYAASVATHIWLDASLF